MIKLCSVIQYTKDSYNHQKHWKVLGEIWTNNNQGVYVTNYSHGWIPVYRAFRGWATNIETAIKHFF